MQTNSKEKNYRILKLSLLGALITAILFFALTSLANCNPLFGGELYGGDLPDQYLSFFQYYRHLLMGNWNNLGYSFSNGLGGAMAGDIGYYLLSPLNLIVLLFPASQINLALYLIILIKLSFATGAFTWVILKWFNFKYNGYAVFLGLAYGLNAYCITYCANLMWLDGIILLPLVIYFLVNGLQGKSWLPYMILLACAIIFNYYTGYMICIFAVIVFLAYTINYFKNLKHFFELGVKFAFSSLVSGCISAFVTLPTLLNLSSNKLTQTEITENFTINAAATIKHTISRLFIGDILNGMPTVFVGSLVILACLLYFFDFHNSLKERIINIAIGVIFAVSFIVPKVYLFWHGGQKTIAFPYRFVFITIFWVLILAAKELSQFEIKKSQLAIATVIYCILALIMIDERRSFGMPIFYAKISILFIVIICLGLYFFNNKVIRHFLLAIAVLELSINGYLKFKEMSLKSNGFYSSYITYNQKLFKKIPEKYKQDRLSKNYFLNNDRGESYALNYHGAEIFSSNNDPRISDLYNNLGLSAYGYYYFYQTGTVATDALFNIGTSINSDLANQSISPSYVSYGLRDDLKQNPIILKQKNITVYKNPTFPLIFAGDLSNNLKLEPDDPIYNQNLVLNSLTQTKKNILSYSNNVPEIQSKRMRIEKEGEKLLLKRTSTTRPGYVTYTYRNLKPNQVGYLIFNKELENYIDVLSKSRNAKTQTDLQITINNKPVYLLERAEQPIGIQADSNGVVKVKLRLSQQRMSILLTTPKLVNIDKKALQQKVAKAQSRKLKTSVFKENEIKGTITTKKGENLVTTIPYSNGWKAVVDGKKAAFDKTLGVFLGLKLTPGKHTVTLSYAIPGLKIGILISLVGIISLITYRFVRKGKKK